MDIFNRFRSDLKSVARVSVDGKNYLRVDSIQGSIMYLPRHGYNMLWGMLFYGCWEPKETEFVKKVLKPGMTAVDVGAFVGYYTLLFARLVGKEGVVACFEPLDEAREACMESAKANGYGNICFSKRIVSNYTGKTLYNADTLFAGGEGSEVDTIDLDTALCGQNRVDFVKVDVEGNDYKVLEGMKETIKKNPDVVIMVEYCPTLWKRCGSEPSNFLSFAKSLGLETNVLLDNGKFERFSNRHVKYDSFPGKSVKELELVDLYVETLVLCRNSSKVLG